MNKLPPPYIPQWILDMLPSPLERYMLEVEDQHLHIMEHGKGFPIILLHGNPTWGFLYRKIIEELPSDQFRCIMPDLVGLGFSSKPEKMDLHTLQNHADWISGVLDQLGLKEAIFVGQDWGGAIGLHALSRKPEIMKGLVLLNTMVRPPRPNFRATTFHRFSRLPLISDFVFRILGYPQKWLHTAQGDPSSIRGKVSKAYSYPIRGLKRNCAPLAMARMVPDSQEHPSVSRMREVETYVKQFHGPTSIVWGLRDPVLGRAMNAHKKILPQATVVTTQGGHFLQEEEYHEIAQAIQMVRKKILANVE